MFSGALKLTFAFTDPVQQNWDFKVGDRGGVKVGEKVTENQSKILNAIQKNAHINTKDLSLLVGILTIKIEKNIRKLKEKDLLKSTGPDKDGHWEIIASKN